MDANNQQSITPTATPIPIAPEKKKKFPVAIIIVIVVILGGYLLVSMVLKNFAKELGGPNASDFLNYVEKKYGKDEGFKILGYRGGSFFEVGYVSYNMTSKRSDEPFMVTYGRNKGYSDNYYTIQYKKELEDYEYNIFGKPFEDAVPYKYAVNVDYSGLVGTYPLLNEDDNYSSFDELIELIDEKRRNANSHNEVSIDIVISDEDISQDRAAVVEWELMAENVNDVIGPYFAREEAKKDPSIKLYAPDNDIRSVSFVLYDDDNSLTGGCPDQFEDISGRRNDYARFTKNGDALICSYQIRY